MQTHSEFTDWVEVRPGIRQRQSSNPMNNLRYGMVIEIEVGGETYHAEPETRSSWVSVKNGPFFSGGETYYRTKFGPLSSIDQFIDKLLETQNDET